jgi:hypothetical protein
MTLFDADALMLLVAVTLVLLLVGAAALLSLRARSRVGAVAGMVGMIYSVVQLHQYSLVS